MKNWTLDDIAWDRLDRSKVDPDILQAIKAAAMVEANGDDYGRYLSNVFADDPEFLVVVDAWAREEVRHGEALGRWPRWSIPASTTKIAAAVPGRISRVGRRGEVDTRQPLRRTDGPLHCRGPVPAATIRLCAMPPMNRC